jgi:hypothetical protein
MMGRWVIAALGAVLAGVLVWVVFWRQELFHAMETSSRSAPASIGLAVKRGPLP